MKTLTEFQAKSLAELIDNDGSCPGIFFGDACTPYNCPVPEADKNGDYCAICIRREIAKLRYEIETLSLYPSDLKSEYIDSNGESTLATSVVGYYYLNEQAQAKLRLVGRGVFNGNRGSYNAIYPPK